MSDFVNEVLSGKTIYMKFMPMLKEHPELLDDLGMKEMSNWSNGSLEHCDVGNEFHMGNGQWRDCDAFTQRTLRHFPYNN